MHVTVPANPSPLSLLLALMMLTCADACACVLCSCSPRYLDPEHSVTSTPPVHNNASDKPSDYSAYFAGKCGS